MWQEGLTGGEIGFYQGRAGFDPARPSLLMLHGAGGRGEGFLPQLSGLKGVNAAALDLPGHVATPGPSRDLIEDYAEWLAARLASGPLKPVLLGHSMGGAVAQCLAANHPRLLKGLVLMSTGPRLPVNPALLEGLKSDFLGAVGLMVKWAYGPQAEPAMLTQGMEQLSKTDPQVMHGDFLACQRFDFREELGRINLPCLILVGADDKMTPVKLSQAMAQAIPGAEIRVIEGAGHMPHVEQHRQVNAALEEFLSRF